MIVSKTPLRVSFIGGGSDYREFFSAQKGLVIGSTVDLFVYVSLLKLNDVSDEKIRFSYRKTESVQNIADLQHPVLREVLKLLAIGDDLNISTMSHVPGQTGLGSSSAFTVGVLNLLSYYSSEVRSKAELAELAVKIEREILKEAGGLQDQFFAAYGGLNAIEFSEKNINVIPLVKNEKMLDEISSFFALIPSKQTRLSSDFAVRTQSKIQSRSSYFNLLQENTKFANSSRERILNSLNAEEIAGILGNCISESWQAKQSTFSFSDLSTLKDVSVSLKNHGASTFKVCGAGHKGFILAYFPDGSSKEIARNHNENWIPIKFINRGSTVFEF